MMVSMLVHLPMHKVTRRTSSAAFLCTYPLLLRCASVDFLSILVLMLASCTHYISLSCLCDMRRSSGCIPGVLVFPVWQKFRQHLLLRRFIADVFEDRYVCRVSLKVPSCIAFGQPESRRYQLTESLGCRLR